MALILSVYRVNTAFVKLMITRLKLLFFILLLPFGLKAQTVDFVFTNACVYDTVFFYNTSQSTDSIISAKWDFDMDGDFDDDTGDTAWTIFGNAGTQNVGLRIITAGGVAKAIYKAIDMGFRPEADFEVSNTCFGEITEFENLTVVEQGDLSEFKWYFGDGTTDSINLNPEHEYEEVGQYRVSLKVRTSGACSDSVSQEIVVANQPARPAIIFSGDTTFQIGDSLVMTVVGTFDRIEWSTGDTTESTTVKETGLYTVTVFNGSCSNSRSVQVKAVNILPEKEVLIQNVITPNGDGFNDEWVIDEIDDFRPCAVNVINQRGNTVFSTSNYNDNWGGTHNGNPLPEGTYYYVIKCLEGESFKGAINIIR